MNALLPLLAGLAQGTQQREQRNYERGLQQQDIDRRELDSFMGDLHQMRQQGMPFQQAQSVLQSRYAKTPQYLQMVKDGSIAKYFEKTPQEIQNEQNKQKDFDTEQEVKKSAIDYNNNRLQSAEEIAKTKLDASAEVRDAQAKAANALAELRRIQGEQAPYNTAVKYGEIKYSGKGIFAPNTDFGNNHTGQVIGNVVNSVSPGETTTTNINHKKAQTKSLENKPSPEKIAAQKTYQADVKAYRNGDMTKHEFIVKYPGVEPPQISPMAQAKLNNINARTAKTEQPPKTGGSSRSSRSGGQSVSGSRKGHTVLGIPVDDTAWNFRLTPEQIKKAHISGYSNEAIAREPVNVKKGLDSLDENAPKSFKKYTPKYMNGKYGVSPAKNKTPSSKAKTLNNVKILQKSLLKRTLKDGTTIRID